MNTTVPTLPVEEGLWINQVKPIIAKYINKPVRTKSNTHLSHLALVPVVIEKVKEK